MNSSFKWSDPETWPKVLNELIDALASDSPPNADRFEAPLNYHMGLGMTISKMLAEGPYLRGNIAREFDTTDLSFPQVVGIVLAVYWDRIEGKPDKRTQYVKAALSTLENFVVQINSIRVNDVISMHDNWSEQYVITEAQPSSFIAIGMKTRLPIVIEHELLEFHKIVVRGGVIPNTIKKPQ